MSNRVLIAGHSQVKYFDQYLKLSNVDVVSFSGYRIEQLQRYRSPNWGKYPWNDTPSEVLEHYQKLVQKVLQVNSRCQILLSGQVWVIII
jgi:hypothetical protein